MNAAPRFSRFAWKEFLRGPLGTPIVLVRGIRPVGRLMPIRLSALKTWRRLSSLPLSTRAKKFLYRTLWVLPLGPGDPATLRRVVARHQAFFRARAARA